MFYCKKHLGFDPVNKGPLHTTQSSLSLLHGGVSLIMLKGGKKETEDIEHGEKRGSDSLKRNAGLVAFI